MQEDCCYKPRSSFNGIDYLSESFYNTNPKYPHRMNPCLHIFEMDWVNLELKKRPRPFYPLSSLMTRETAVRYIQAYLRGYWVRKRPELNEIRTFWKTIQFKRCSIVQVDNETLVDKKHDDTPRNKLNNKKRMSKANIKNAATV
ncbi:unnamed protein product [Diabrotica balteata]|uniref:Uncharacterized protein n=1 Tax=Diabrotica balteata TaxID=107213 RepID=A0A9N9STN1_DIABA|nr:unnamed protein product [Diabrotica balteata]